MKPFQCNGNFILLKSKERWKIFWTRQGSNQSHRTKLPYFRNELVEKSVNGQNWQTGQSYFLAIYVYKNLKSSLQMMAFYMRKISGGSGIRTHHDLLPWFIILLLLHSNVGVIRGESNWGNLYQVTLLFSIS